MAPLSYRKKWVLAHMVGERKRVITASISILPPRTNRRCAARRCVRARRRRRCLTSRPGYRDLLNRN
jgi:hypothetical protein